jgi:AcrR family transcriptional regulator
VTALGRRERTKAANRAAILDAARQAFAEQGYEAAAVRDIVRRTDLASGTFYNYFHDKDAIFGALIAETGEEARRRVRAARRSARTAAEFVEGGYRAFFEFIVEEPARFAFMRRNLETIANRFGEQVLPASTEELAEDLRTAIAAGHVPPVDVDYCAHAMIAVGLELGARLAERSPPDVEGATRFASTLFLGALSGHESSAGDDRRGPAPRVR